IYPAPYAIFATLWRRDDDPDATRIARSDIARLVRDTRAQIHKRFANRNTTVVLGVNINLWLAWCAQENLSVPLGMRYRFPDRRSDGHLTSTVIARSHGAWADTEGDIWLHIKSD